MKRGLVGAAVWLIVLAVQQDGNAQHSRSYLWDSLRPTSASNVYAGDSAETVWDEAQETFEDACGVDCDCEVCCTDPCCDPTLTVFGEYLALRPGNERIAYAVPINSLILPGPVQAGPDAVVDCGFNSGFRAGFSYALHSYASLGVTYTYFDGNASDQLTVVAPNVVIRSQVNHPGTVAVPTNFLQATANYGVDFQLADLEYRRILTSGELHELHYVIGARYGHLEQGFASVFTNATTIETVNTNILFDGGGIRLGLEGERRAANCGWLIYGRGDASFLGGEYRARYLQADNFRGLVVNSGWNEDRVVSILDLELGFGWTSARGGLRLTTGYMFSGWFNTISTDEFIQAVQTNNSVSVGDTLTFDGLVGRAEFKY